MVAFKASQLTAFLRQPDPRFIAALLYGPDPALVAEQAATLSRRIAQRSDSEAEIVRLDDRDLGEDPGRLEVEARTVPMFSSGKVVRLAAGPRLQIDTVEALLANPAEAFLIVEAGGLRPTAPLRKLFEKAERAVALPCYEIAARDMAQFIDGELAGSSVTATPEARQQLVTLFGGDPAKARAELAKLALYVGDGGRAAPEDVDAVIGDVAEAALESLGSAAAGGSSGDALGQFDRLVAGGQGAQGAIAAIGRHFERLHRFCAALEAGDSTARALGQFRPPLHFRQKDALEAQARRWSRAAAAKAVERINQAALTARRRPELEQQIAAQLLIALARSK